MPERSTYSSTLWTHSFTVAIDAFNPSKALGLGTLKPGIPAGAGVLAPDIVRLDGDDGWDEEGDSGDSGGVGNSGRVGDSERVVSATVVLDVGGMTVRASFPFRSESLMDTSGCGFDVCARRV